MLYFYTKKDALCIKVNKLVYFTKEEIVLKASCFE